jgi:hypothetical protein
VNASRTTPIAWICQTCGVQVAPAKVPPAHCAICQDARQYVGWAGQHWLDPRSLAATHHIAFREEHGVTTLHQVPGVAINQRAFLIPTGQGNVMWECLSVCTDAAIATLRVHGGVAAIAISHPHFYSAMVDWSDALGGVPIYVHAEDAAWIARPSKHIERWRGARLDLAADVALVHLGGHFAGSAGLWWRTGPRAGGSLFPGDALQVTMDRRSTTFMYSYPNAIPLGPSAVGLLRARVAPLAFEDVFGYNAGREIIGDAKRRVEASFDRYLAAIAA